MEHEKLSYAEALRWLANRYNVEIEETEMSPEKKLQQQTSESLYIINSFAQKFFEEQLWHTEAGQSIALSYLHERGFTLEIIQKFGIGYAPEGGQSFVTAATKNQFNKELLQKSGLVAERNGQLVDNYRDRIVFPIHGNTGKLIGFGARLIKSNDKAPKYINTPENEIYVKSKILYGLYQARHAIDKNDECLLVEGYTDVVSLHQAGIENVVASGGTSLTQDQLRLIKKYTKNLTIIYDGDAAGIKAAMRGLDMALEESLNVRLVLVPDKEDPDSYVKKVGAQEFRNFILHNKKDFIYFQIEVALRDAGDDAQKKQQSSTRSPKRFQRLTKPKTSPDSRITFERAPNCCILMKPDLPTWLISLSATGFHCRNRKCRSKKPGSTRKMQKQRSNQTSATIPFSSFTRTSCRNGRSPACCWNMVQKPGATAINWLPNTSCKNSRKTT